MFFHVKRRHLEAINQAKASGIPPESLCLDPKTFKKSKKELKKESQEKDSNFTNSRFVSAKESDPDFEPTANQPKKIGSGFNCEVCDVKILKGHYPKHIKSCKHYSKFLTITKFILKCNFCKYEIQKGTQRSNIYRHLKDRHLKDSYKF